MSLINDALKRASEAQAQAATRPRGPKGVEDLPVPMTPVATRERPAWLPIAGISVLILALLGASGFFFSKWWKERKAWQPYVERPPDPEPPTNSVAKAKPPAPKPAASSTNNPVVKTNVDVAVVPPVKPVLPEPPPPPPANSVAAIAMALTTTNPPTPVTPQVTPPVVPPVVPPTVAVVETNRPPAVVPPPVKPPPDTTKKPDDTVTKVAAVEFPDIKLQGIIRGKKKTTAIVNGKTLSLGDRVEGAFLLKIDQESVTFEKGSTRREFFLLR